jgi:rhodanese-related sulfurtransferase
MAKHSPAFLKLVESIRPHIKELSIDDVKKKLERGEAFQLIDVREDHEWNAGHLPGALHLGKGIIERDVEAKFPDQNAELVLYCGGGFRSALAADNLQKMGYTKVYSMDGGWRGWNDAKLPIEKDGAAKG